MSPPIKVTNEEARKAYHIRTSSQFLILVYSVVYSLFSWFLIFYAEFLTEISEILTNF